MSDPLEKELKELEEEFKQYSDQLLEISREMMEGKYTEFPIFVAHQTDVYLGQVLIDRTEYEEPFSVSVSTVEEFVETGLIEKDKLKVFLEAFGDPLKNMCIFWVHGDQARYILMHYAGRITDKD